MAPLTIEEKRKAGDIARTNPYDYVWEYGYHKNPELLIETKRMLRDILHNAPMTESFFKYEFDKVPEFKEYVGPMAEKLLVYDPLGYISTYRIHKKPGLEYLLPALFENFKKMYGDLLTGLMKDENSSIAKDLLYIVDQISRHNPKYYVESGLAEDEEFGRFFGNVGKKSYIVCVLTKIANDLDLKKEFELANQIDEIIKTTGE